MERKGGARRPMGGGRVVGRRWGSGNEDRGAAVGFVAEASPVHCGMSRRRGWSGAYVTV